MWETRSTYKILVGKLENRRPRERLGLVWEDNIEIDATDWVGTCGLDSSGSGQGPVAGPCQVGYELSDSTKGCELLGYLRPVGSSRRALLHGVRYVEQMQATVRSCIYAVKIIFPFFLPSHTNWNISDATRNSCPCNYRQT
jgi:hypothetical protein